MANEQQAKASAKYDKKNTKMYHMKVNFNTEKEIHEQLQKQSNVSGYIKSLILKDIENTK